MKPAALKKLPPTQLASSLSHNFYARERKKIGWQDKELIAVLVVLPRDGEGPRKELRFNLSKGWGGSFGIKYNGTYRECVSLAEDADHLWENWQAWLKEHAPTIIEQMSRGLKPTLPERFCKPRPKQGTLF